MNELLSQLQTSRDAAIAALVLYDHNLILFEGRDYERFKSLVISFKKGETEEELTLVVFAGCGKGSIDDLLKPGNVPDNAIAIILIEAVGKDIKARITSKPEFAGRLKSVSVNQTLIFEYGQAGEDQRQFFRIRNLCPLPCPPGQYCELVGGSPTCKNEGDILSLVKPG